MKALVHLVMNRRGVVRMTKNKPDLARDEIAVGIRLEVPDSAFLAPLIYADLTVPDHAVIVPEVKVEIEPASVDTHPEGGDDLSAPFMGSAVGESRDAQPSSEAP